MIARLVLAISLIMLAGCGTSPVPAPSQPLPDQVQSATVAPTTTAKVDPRSISISKIGVESSLIPLGEDAQGKHEIPSVKTPEQAGWYEMGPEPGEIGPSIILGHIDGSGKRGVFYDLKKLVVGDKVHITLVNDVELKFVVTKTETVHKDEFPEDRVYGFTPKRELRLITCGGAFDRSAGHYTDNTIVYAELDQSGPVQ